MLAAENSYAESVCCPSYLHEELVKDPCSVHGTQKAKFYPVAHRSTGSGAIGYLVHEPIPKKWSFGTI